MGRFKGSQVTQWSKVKPVSHSFFCFLKPHFHPNLRTKTFVNCFLLELSPQSSHGYSFVVIQVQAFLMAQSNIVPATLSLSLNHSLSLTVAHFTFFIHLIAKHSIIRLLKVRTYIFHFTSKGSQRNFLYSINVLTNQLSKNTSWTEKIL